MIEMDVDAAQHELDTLNLNSPPARPMAHLLPSFEALPPELLEQIAFQLCRQTPHGPPTALLSLLCAGRSFYDVLGPRNEGFYADLFKERFDWRSAERRWKVMRDIEGKREKRMLLDEVSEVRADADLVLNPAGSFTRSSSPTASEYVPTSSSPWRDLTSKDLALEFKRRNTVLTRMRTAVLSGMIPPSSSRPNTPRAGSPRLSPMTPTGNFKLPVLEPDELTQNLWTCYLMLLENGAFCLGLALLTSPDSKNLAHLVEYGLLRTYMKLFYKHSLLSEALRPGWPRQSAGRALGLWIGWLAGGTSSLVCERRLIDCVDDISTESSSESDERFFVLKPYVFGAHKVSSRGNLAPLTRAVRCVPRSLDHPHAARHDVVASAAHPRADGPLPRGSAPQDAGTGDCAHGPHRRDRTPHPHARRHLLVLLPRRARPRRDDGPHWGEPGRAAAPWAWCAGPPRRHDGQTGQDVAPAASVQGPRPGLCAARVVRGPILVARAAPAVLHWPDRRLVGGPLQFLRL